MLTLFRWSKDRGLEVSDAMREGFLETEDIVWLDLESPAAEEVAVLRSVFRFHPLALEDISPRIHHPKVDDFEGYLFLVMHAVMKTLTIIATIFIPLTFIAGIYGMNFEYMPELTGRYSYFVCVGIMVILGLSLFRLFKRKRWF